MIAELLQYNFIWRALLVGVLVVICAALLGVTLVLKRYSMIGDGLSHVGFGALSIAAALNVSPLAVSVPVSVIAAYLMLRLTESGKLKGDASIAIISSSAIAVGVTVTALTSGLNTDVYSYMFGSIYTVTAGDMWLSIGLAAAVITMYVLFFNKIFAVAFDESFALATGTNTRLYNTVTALLTAITVVIGMRIIGTLLISSIIIFPALSSMRVFRSFKGVVVFSAAISVACFIVGVVVSFAVNTPTAATVVLANLAAFIVCAVVGYVRARLPLKGEDYNA